MKLLTAILMGLLGALICGLIRVNNVWTVILVCCLMEIHWHFWKYLESKDE